MQLLDEKEISAEAGSDTTAGSFETRVYDRYRRMEWLIAALFCAVLWGQVLLSSSRLSLTVDEATHLYSGYRYLKCGDLTVSPEHPPLAKVIDAAPLLGMNLPVDCAPFQGDALQQAFQGLEWLFSTKWPVTLAWARAAASLFAVVLFLLVWISARHMFDLATAIVAGALLIFEPNILAFSALVMTDIPVTCMLLLAVWGFYLWLKHRTIPFFLLTALAAGLTLLTKDSGVVVLPILGMLAVTDAWTHREIARPRRRVAIGNLLSVALIGSLAIGVVWAGYGMRFSRQPGFTEIAKARSSSTSITQRALWGLEKHRLLPEAYLHGFGGAIEISGQTTVAFVAGKVYPRAPWFSTAFNFLIRNTEAMLVMMIAAFFGIGIAITSGPRRRERLFLLVPAAVYLGVCLHASSDVSIRYLLPMFPFLLIMVADGCVQLSRRAHWMRYALPCLLVLHAASSLYAYPNYVSYGNDFWGGPAQAYKYQASIDMGQAYPQARAYIEKHPAENCWFLVAWQWDPKFYGVPCQSFGLYLTNQIPPHVHGTVIVSSSLLRDVRIAEGGIAAGFRDATPKDEIGGSALLVYEGDFDTHLAAAAGESSIAMRAFSAGDLSGALIHGERAVDLAPSSPLVHANLCRLLASNRVDAALKECTIARSLLMADPFRYERTRAKYLELLNSSIAALTTNYRILYGHEAEIVEAANP